eukprot:3317590-Pyramimonas_sp.AAC.1
MSMMLQRGWQRKPFVQHVERHLSREYERVIALPPREIADEANRVLMAAVNEAGAIFCCKSPLYTEDHTRHAREVKALLEQRRTVRHKFDFGYEEVEGEDL